MIRRLLIIALLLAAGGAARATTMLRLDLKALTERADRIVLGTVEASESRWTDDHDAIYTDVTLRVDKSYKGAVKAGETLVVRREGGSVGGIGMRVYGAPAFTVGEQAVVFVEQRGEAAWVVGMAQGKLRVLHGADGAARVWADLAEVAFTDGGPTTGAAQLRPLADLEKQIRTLVRSAR